jgi:hypothetical protein
MCVVGTLARFPTIADRDATRNNHDAPMLLGQSYQPILGRPQISIFLETMHSPSFQKLKSLAPRFSANRKPNQLMCASVEYPARNDHASIAELPPSDVASPKVEIRVHFASSVHDGGTLSSKTFACQI